MARDIRTLKSILTKFGYVLQGTRIQNTTRYNLIDRRGYAWLTIGYPLTAEDVDKWVEENLNLDNLYIPTYIP